jgi:carboxypeptidase family protein
MKVINSLVCILVIVLLAPCLAHAQGVGSSGDISGTITDPTGAVVPKANLTAVETDRGARHTAITDDRGQYRITGLSPASYDITAEIQGFGGEIQKGVVVTVGATTIVDFHLKVSTSKVTVEVSAQPPIVEVERGSQADTVVQRYISDLPIDRRDYLTFTLLMPGVSNSTVIADNADFRVKQTPQSGLSFYGSNGRGNSVTVDGGEANDDAGGVRLTVSQDGVQEFQINRSNYNADLGGASGASINIVSKSGTNDLHGTVFGFFRNDAMDAADPFSISPALAFDPTFSNFNTTSTGTPIKNSLNRQQFGGSVGLPIKKDKTFLFVSYEGLHSNSQDAVPLLTNSSIFAGPNAAAVSNPFPSFDPRFAQQNVISGLAGLGAAPVPCLSDPTNPISGPPIFQPANVCAVILAQCLSTTPTAACPTSPGHTSLSQFAILQFEGNGGLFSFPIRSNLGSVRLDHRVNENNQLTLHYSAGHLTESDPDVQALTAISRGTSELAWDSTLQGAWYHQFSPTAQNELRVQMNMYQFNVNTNDPGGPGLDVEGYGFFGRGIFLPSHTRAGRYEFADNLSLIRGRHTFKMGFYELVRGNNTTSQTFFPARFEFLELPGIVLSPCLQIPAACGLATTPTAAVSNLQSLSLGLPGFYEQGFGNPAYQQTRPFTAFYGQDTWQIRPNFTLSYGLRYELDSQYGPLNTPKKNFAPRASFAWDPFHDHKTVIRGGYGIFYSPIYAQIPGVVSVLGNVNGTRKIANTLVKLTGVPGAPTIANSAVIFQTLLAEGVFPCVPPPGQFACITRADLTQFNLSVPNTGPLPPGTVLFAGQPNYRSPISQQGSFGIERELGAGFTLSLSYIYVHTQHLPVAIDRNLLPGAPIDTGASGLPSNGIPIQDWGNPICAGPSASNPCFADPSLTILQNNVYSSVASAVYNGGILELKKRFSDHFTMMANYTYSHAIDESTDFNSDYSPFNATTLNAERASSDFDQRHKVVVAGVFDSPFKSVWLSGFELSPLFTYNSGHPFNLLAGADINSDNHFTNDRPPGAPRNSGLGPNLINFDMRLSRTFRFGERYGLQLIAEGFNLANRTNYASVNNIVGPAFAPPFNAKGTAALSPSQPLGFTAAFPKREIQLGFRFNF